MFSTGSQAMVFSQLDRDRPVPSVEEYINDRVCLLNRSGFEVERSDFDGLEEDVKQYLSAMEELKEEWKGDRGEELVKDTAGVGEEVYNGKMDMVSEVHRRLYSKLGERVEDPFESIQRSVAGTEVAIHGVLHTDWYLAMYEERLMDVVTSSDGVVLESVVGGSVYDSVFFGSLAERADSDGVPVYHVDPINEATKMVENVKDHVSRECLQGGGMLASVLGVFSGDFELVNGGIMAMGAGTYLDEVGEWMPDDLSEEGWSASFLRFGIHDYRDVTIASGIQDICDTNGYTSLSVVHGDYHKQPIAAYLDNEVVRSAKRQVYVPFRFAGDENVREVGGENAWYGS